MKKKLITSILAFTILLTSFSYGEAKEVKYIPVLTYHHFQDNFPVEKSASICTPENFKKHMKYLNDIGYNTITFNDLEKAKNGESNLPPNPIIISIDDGYLSAYTCAYPILKELNMKANLNILYNINEINKKLSKSGGINMYDYKINNQITEQVASLTDSENKKKKVNDLLETISKINNKFTPQTETATPQNVNFEKLQFNGMTPEEINQQAEQTLAEYKNSGIKNIQLENKAKEE